MKIEKNVKITITTRELVEILKKKLYKEQNISVSDLEFVIKPNAEGKQELIEVVLDGLYRGLKK